MLDKICQLKKFDSIEEVRVATHTNIYRGVFQGETYYVKILKNYNKRVKSQDVLRSKGMLEEIGLKCFDVVDAGVIEGEKYYISREVKGFDFEQMLDGGRTFQEIEGLITQSMEMFVRMLMNDLFYFGYNLKNFMLEGENLILIDVEEVQRKSFFKRKARVKTVWNALRSLKAGASRCNISYERLEDLFFKVYEEKTGEASRLKRDIALYMKVRDIKKKRKR
ncbi:hypothetical protein [Propionigenium maris]|uniref:hypothetical protein n=1 Tax=Propionigenium maris TaxID=45622 RepID=UPI0024935580|nr:hypothetical protein [Propionigenium maris]